MLISKTPYRISFFGGGTDFPQWYNHQKGLTISTTLDYHQYISARFLPPFFKRINYKISYSKTENVEKVSEINHPVIKKLFLYKKIHKPLELHINSDLPARSGLGSSSTFIVGLINLLYNLYEKKINQKKLYNEAINFEQNILKEYCGSQDQVITSIGGFKKIEYFKKNIDVKKLNISSSKKKKLERSLALFFTGFSRKAALTEKDKILSIKKNRSYYEDLYNLALQSVNIFENNNTNIDEIGRLMNDSWSIKKKLSKKVSNSKIDEIYKCDIKNGAIGGKVLGAGNGGFMLFYIDASKKKKLISSLKKLLYVPVKFSEEGSKIIYQNKEKIHIEQKK